MAQTFPLGFPDPIQGPEEWDRFFIAGHPSPGIIAEWDAGKESEWDVKRGKGARGATLTYTGEKPAEPKFTLHFWLSQHFADWQVFRSLLKYDPSKKTITALDIYHPALADAEITSVVLRTVSAIKKVSPTLYAVEIAFIEYRPPLKSAVGTPDTSRATSKGLGAGGANQQTGDPPDPIAEAQIKQIKTLLDQAKAP